MSVAGDPALPAGEFGAWLAELRASLRDDRAMDVACGDCSGCCTASYFVTLRPNDVAARAHIPQALRVPAPNGPPGHELVGYDERGHCPMLADGRCTIHAHRPQTCRTYDCRVYAAAGIAAGGPAQARITQRSRQWSFEYADERARRAHAAVIRAARFLRDDAASFPRGRAPSRPPEVAVAAIKVYALFLDDAVPDDAAAKRALAQRVIDVARAFDAGDEGVADHAAGTSAGGGPDAVGAG